MASERRSRAEHQIANRRSGGYDVTHEVAVHHDKMPHAEAQRHPCDSGASGTAVAGLAATPTHSNYLHIYIFRQFRKSAPGEQLNALRGQLIAYDPHSHYEGKRYKPPSHY